MKFFETLRLLTTILIFTTISAVGQTLPDSIIITRITYVNRFMDGSDTIYRTENYSIVLKGKAYKLFDKRIGKSEIENLIAELSNENNYDNSLAKYGIDTNWIKSNPTELFKLYSDKERIEWNEKQKQYIFKELTNIANFIRYLNDYISNGGSYTMHHSYKNEYLIKIYKSDKVSNEIKSRKYVWGFMMPWKNTTNEQIFNYNIEATLNNILSSKNKAKEPLTGDKLLEYLVNKIIDYNMQPLYKLTAYSYTKEIDELKTDFTIISSEEVYGRGRYIWNEPKTIKIVLKNKLMFDNVNLVFLVSEYGKALYSRDSIKKDYTDYINRIQSITFVADYLKANPNSRLDIYYFNNKGINEYNVDGVNKNPNEWVKYDKWIEGLKWDSAHNIKLDFDIDESIKTSRQVNCGCNYRLDRSYIEKAIFFEINDTNRNNSIWFLLPDNKVLLYLMQGDKVLDYNYKDFGESRGLQYPCKLFDIKGQMISK